MYMVAVRENVYSPGPVFAGTTSEDFLQFFPNPSFSLHFSEWAINASSAGLFSSAGSRLVLFPLFTVH